MELKDKIINAAIDEFNDKGLRFTMDDLAKRLTMSKKTIYTVVRDKEALFAEMVEYGFKKIKECEQQIYEDEQLDVVEKIKQMLIALPERFRTIDFRKMYELRDTNPKVYELIHLKIETGWEQTLELLEQGIKEEKIRPINVIVFKTMVEASLERFIRDETLLSTGVYYNEALSEMVKILMEGVVV